MVVFLYYILIYLFAVFDIFIKHECSEIRIFSCTFIRGEDEVMQKPIKISSPD